MISTFDKLEAEDPESYKDIKNFNGASPAFSTIRNRFEVHLRDFLDPFGTATEEILVLDTRRPKPDTNRASGVTPRTISAIPRSLAALFGDEGSVNFR
jgi:hypothetical protein